MVVDGFPQPRTICILHAHLPSGQSSDDWRKRDAAYQKLTSTALDCNCATTPSFIATQGEQPNSEQPAGAGFESSLPVSQILDHDLVIFCGDLVNMHYHNGFSFFDCLLSRITD